MFNAKLTTCQRSDKINFSLIEKVVSFSLEARVLFCFNDKYDIAGNRVRRLICFPSKRNPLTLLHTFVDMNVQDFTFICDLLPITFLALVLCRDNLTFPIAVWT